MIELTVASRLVRTVADDLCLDLVNTRSWRGRDQPTESLATLSDVLQWCRSAAILTEREIARLHTWELHNRKQARSLHAKLIAVRELIHAIFGRVADRAMPRPADLHGLSRLLDRAPRRVSLVVKAGQTAWRVPPAEPTPPSLLAPVLWSAGERLTGAQTGRVRRCANPECRWLFLDDSKAGTRRWCSMASCGNREKARRHYARIATARRRCRHPTSQDSPSHRQAGRLG